MATGLKTGEDREEGGKETILDLPLLPRRDILVYPHLFSQIVVIRPQFQRALEEAVAGDR